MNEVNQTIIDSVIRKAESVCPDSLALIGVYGSVATGDEHEKSDLDLLILINDDRGWQLGTGFILDDICVGYDIYCTNRDGIEWEAKCNHAHLSKLMDSKIVYVHDKEAVKRLEELKGKAKKILTSNERFEKAKEAVKNAKLSFAEAGLTSSLSKVRTEASKTISYLLDAIMLFNGRYFHLGIKRTFDEMKDLKLSFSFFEDINTIVKSENDREILFNLANIIKLVENYITVKQEKEQPSADNISGTYEEMYSNWRNKVEEAADKNDRYASFMNLCSLQNMLDEIASDVEMNDLQIMSEYDPEHLENNVKLYDKTLEKYKENYTKAGIKPIHYADIHEFDKNY